MKKYFTIALSFCLFLILMFSITLVSARETPTVTLTSAQVVPSNGDIEIKFLSTRALEVTQDVFIEIAHIP